VEAKMNFMYRLLKEKLVDEDIHRQFRRFSKGIFEKKAMVYFGIRRNNVKIKTTYEYCNDLVELFIRKARGVIQVSGFISGGRNFAKETSYEFIECKNRMRTFKGQLKPFECSVDELKKLYETFKDDFILLNLSADNCWLKCKNNLPKPGKESVKKTGEARIDFCSGEFEFDIISEFSFDATPSKDFKVEHRIEVEEIIAPSGVSDMAKIRLMAKRKGTITREMDVDGKKVFKEYEFEC